MAETHEEIKESWLKWLESYGADKFYDAFLRTVEGAESVCIYCGRTIQVDITIGGGVPDWHMDGDFGCPDNPENSEEGTCGHVPRGKE